MNKLAKVAISDAKEEGGGGDDAKAKGEMKRRIGKMRASSKLIAAAVKEKGGATKRGAFAARVLYQPGAAGHAEICVRDGDDELARIVGRPDPTNPRLLKTFERDFMPALNGYGSALRLKLDDGDAHARRGLTYLRMREEQMAKFLRTGAGGDPQWWLRLDDLVDKALTCFRQARNADESNAATHYGLGCALVAKGEHAKAESSFCRAEQLRPRRFNPIPEIESDHLRMLTEMLKCCTDERDRLIYEQPYSRTAL